MSEAVIVNADVLGRIGIVNPMKVDKEKEEAPTEEEEEGEGDGKETTVLRNQFNFCDRATQGQIISYMNEGTLTEAPRPNDCTG
jgi:hypothetical protein